MTNDELNRKAQANGFTDINDAISKGRCPSHPAFEADYCPACGTTHSINRDRIINRG